MSKHGREVGSQKTYIVVQSNQRHEDDCKTVVFEIFPDLLSNMSLSSYHGIECKHCKNTNAHVTVQCRTSIKGRAHSAVYMHQ